MQLPAPGLPQDPRELLKLQPKWYLGSQAKSSPKSYGCFLKTAFLEFQHHTCSNSLLQNLVIWFYLATGGVGICGNLLRANIWISVPKAASTLNTIQQLSGEKLMLDLGLEKDLFELQIITFMFCYNFVILKRVVVHVRIWSFLYK